ncbi:integrase catalytic domain-containing protein [Trichonephila clavipes]|nr:integrase catalytic domain-containing protein [Trichonephila clavipes]
MDEPIKTFELSTVTYGTTSAPFLATRMLKQLALDEAENFPLGSSVVMSDMYIDDVLTGAEILLEAKELKNQLINIFAKGAVHLDIVTDLTFNAFIATLKRFIFRRGKCAKLYSDNATNFVDANIELKKMFHLVCKPDEALASYMASEGIDWKFLPPRALNFGGLWKARVKSFKFYLKRVVGNIRLTYEEFLTVIIQIKGMLNSRPLVSLSSDLDDLNVLTPFHFLIGRSITSIVEPDLTNLNEDK